MDESPPVGGFPLAVPLDTINANLATASVERIILTVQFYNFYDEKGEKLYYYNVGATIRMRPLEVIWSAFALSNRSWWS